MVHSGSSNPEHITVAECQQQYSNIISQIDSMYGGSSLFANSTNSTTNYTEIYAEHMHAAEQQYREIQDQMHQMQHQFEEESDNMQRQMANQYQQQEMDFNTTMYNFDHCMSHCYNETECEVNCTMDMLRALNLTDSNSTNSTNCTEIIRDHIEAAKMQDHMQQEHAAMLQDYFHQLGHDFENAQHDMSHQFAPLTDAFNNFDHCSSHCSNMSEACVNGCTDQLTADLDRAIAGLQNSTNATAMPVSLFLRNGNSYYNYNHTHSDISTKENPISNLAEDYKNIRLEKAEIQHVLTFGAIEAGITNYTQSLADEIARRDNLNIEMEFKMMNGVLEHYTRKWDVHVQAEWQKLVAGAHDTCN